MNCLITIESPDVESRLNELNLSRELLLEVVSASVAGYGGCTDNDPPMTRGLESWRWGVRRLRELLVGEQWEKDESGGLATVVNRKLGIRIAVVNTDDATGNPSSPDPQNRVKKGYASKLAILGRQLCLPGSDAWPYEKDFEDYETWHLCIFVHQDEVGAELIRFDGFKNGFFSDCRERIIILENDEWGPLPSDEMQDNFGPDIEVKVYRKSS